MTADLVTRWVSVSKKKSILYFHRAALQKDFKITFLSPSCRVKNVSINAMHDREVIGNAYDVTSPLQMSVEFPKFSAQSTG